MRQAADKTNTRKAEKALSPLLTAFDLRFTIWLSPDPRLPTTTVLKS